MFNDTSKTAKITWFLLVLQWAVDVIEVIYYIHGPVLLGRDHPRVVSIGPIVRGVIAFPILGT